MFYKMLLLFICLLLPTIVQADTREIYPFQTQAQQAQFQRLTEQLRCLVCQNQSLADSHAPLASDLRRKIATLVHQQLSDQAITTFLVQRYGDFVLYQPPLNTQTYLLWFAPILFVIGGLSLLSFFIIRQRRSRGN